MTAEEYDTLIANPSDYFLRTLAPRTLGVLSPLTQFRPLSSLLDKPMQLAGNFASPHIRQAFQSLIAAGEELEKWRTAIAGFTSTAMAAGFPPWRSGMATAPFDTLGDSLRGTRGILTDMFRRPDKILAALDVITPMAIENTIASVNASKGFMVAFPLHKGDDSHMSLQQFEKFYWPSLRKVVQALIDEGILVMLFAEGRYTSRLEAVNDFPKGWVSWHFDQTDMAQAKRILGENCCLVGNVPSSVMVTATPDQVRDCCRELIDICAPGGGYILAGGCSATESNPDNFRAMMQAALAYGRYT